MTRVAHSRGARRLGPSVAALAVAGLALGSCSSSGSSSSSSSSTGSSAATGATGGSSLTAELQALSSKVQTGKGATFKATYTQTGGSSSTQTIVFEQKPPKSYFSSGSGSVINDGTTTYFCSNNSGGGAPTCISSSSSTNPLAAILDIFSGAAFTTFAQSAQAQAAAHAAGYNLSFSSDSFAGQASHCVTATGPTGTTKYCVTDDSGIIAYVSTPDGNVFQLTGFTTSVSDGDFSLPAGATTETLPSGVSVP